MNRKPIAGTTPALFAGIPVHFGLVGERYTLGGVRFVAGYENETTGEVYQRRFSYFFITPQGERLLWYTDTAESFAAGAEGKLTFKVKQHINDGPRTTRIERVFF